MTVKIARICGPPGCGKTTRLMQLVERACDKYRPDNVGAVSFTNAAVNEIKDRMISKHKLHSSEMENVRTIHSHCWRLIGMKEERLAEKHIADFNSKHPDFQINLSKLAKDDDIIKPDQVIKRNERVFSEMNVMRQRMIPKEKWQPDVKAMYGVWKRWMMDGNLQDFTGILEEALLMGHTPDIDVLFVDEAQDLSRLQVNLILQWAQRTVSTILIGDADQAIFRFSGAEPEVFRDLQHEWHENLTQSYRVPPKVHEYAQRMIRQVRGREDVVYKPYLEKYKGYVDYTGEPDLSLEGTHMILSRCNYQAHIWIDYLVNQNMLWHNPYKPDDYALNPCSTSAWRASKTYRDFFGGNIIKLNDFKNMADKIIAKDNLKRGSKKAIADLEMFDYPDGIDIFDMGNMGFTDEFMTGKKPLNEVMNLKGKVTALIDSDESVFEKQPNVIIGTVHSVKGGEADHVWIDCSMPPSVYQATITEEEYFFDEIRILYVAITRAKQGIGLMNYFKNHLIL